MVIAPIQMEAELLFNYLKDAADKIKEILL
jgi:hypothetical protein